MLDFKEEIPKAIAKVTNMEEKQLREYIEIPPNSDLGDYAFPCFKLAKDLRKAPQAIAEDIKANIEIDGKVIERIEIVGGYLNIYINKEALAENVLKEVYDKKEKYGSSNIGKGKNVVIDYSAPNIPKPFHIGHLRSTVIGGALYKIYNFVGYNSVGINYLGDWGLQFGKVMAGYDMWKDEYDFEKSEIQALLKIYVRFNQEEKDNPELTEKAREYFKRLEDGNEKEVEMWKWIRSTSLENYQKTYDLLNSKFDSYNGEAYYNDKMGPVVEELEQKGLLKDSEGAKIVDLEEYDMPPCIIITSAGTTIYATRDLASLKERMKRYDFAKAVYVVGNEQTLHFKQLKEVIHKLGYSWFDKIHHINFGLFLQGGKKMSTRQGKSMKLQDVLEESVALAETYIQEKNPTLEKKQEISKAIGVGAVIFNDLKNYRINDVEFNLEDVLRFEGETGPYVQYTYARIHTILEKQKIVENIYDNVEVNEYVWNIISRIFEFDEMLLLAKRDYDPSVIAKFTLDLCKDFNKFYANHRIITEDPNATNFRLQIATITAIMIKESMRILGIKVPTKM